FGPSPSTAIAASGNIDVSAPGTTEATVLVSGLQPGTYNVTMTAIPILSRQTCSGTTPFMIVAGQTALAHVIVLCKTIVEHNMVAIRGRFDQCPLITGFSATSLEATVGQSVTVGVVASELDPMDVTTYQWTTNAPAIGGFGSANAATTTFTCFSVGSALLS